jgi:hypothetical protein
MRFGSLIKKTGRMRQSIRRKGLRRVAFVDIINGWIGGCLKTARTRWRKSQQ